MLFLLIYHAKLHVRSWVCTKKTPWQLDIAAVTYPAGSPLLALVLDSELEARPN